MFGMLYDCRAFNQPIGDWDTSSVTDMEWFLTCEDTGSFNQDISGWDVHLVEDMGALLFNSAFAKTNYDLLLVAWAAQAVQNSVAVNAGTAHYSAGDPTTAHDHLTGTHSWTISDGGTP
jgi:surface protein